MNRENKPAIVTVIVPVYNVEKTVGRCIRSILKQTYTDWKLVLVNDASPDGSLRICRKYADSDNRIRVVDKRQNEGVDKARFTGLEYADTEYVTFADSDDTLRPQALEKMVEAAIEDDADVTEMGFVRSVDRWRLLTRRGVLKRRCIVQPQLWDEYYITFFGYGKLAVNMWGKLYRTDLIKRAGVKPTGYRRGQDLYFNLYLFPHIRRYSQIEYAGYTYYVGGVTNRYSPTLYADLKSQFFVKVGLLKEHHYPKGEDYVRIEMKNILKTQIHQLLQYKVCDRKRILAFVSDELNSTEPTVTGRTFYEEVTDVPFERIKDNPFFLAFYQKDAEACVRLVEADVRSFKDRLRRLVIKAMAGI